jgi:AcrR family transcriptional regulator
LSDSILERRRETLDALQRRQIIEGFGALAADKGYAGVTISDIARLAHVSKSTFYEHFADKEAVYLDLHAQVAAALEAALEESIERTVNEPDWRARIRDLVRTRLGVVAADPTFLIQAAIEPQLASEAAGRARRRAGRRNARFWIVLSEQLAEATAEVEPIPEHVAYAGMAAGVMFVGGAARQGAPAVRALEDQLTDVWVRLFRAR